ncbi:unnamed protein product [Gordionus sp. m RMFG-2023]|uniref:high affinity cAMP-specific and IBMX-insensitive 3',5'-cyclic phosphodiesterase 8B-like isoform X2 n=1 Tax=Gordionus sp. m RMFG-2023 TaxID=3053472 RepID=UPI0030E2E190
MGCMPTKISSNCNDHLSPSPRLGNNNDGSYPEYVDTTRLSAHEDSPQPQHNALTSGSKNGQNRYKLHKYGLNNRSNSKKMENDRSGNELARLSQGDNRLPPKPMDVSKLIPNFKSSTTEDIDYSLVPDSKRLTERRGTNNAETQTTLSPHPLKKNDDHWHLGPMVIKERQMNILLVFSKEDSQSDGFWWAAQRPGFKCDLVSSSETAVELYLNKNHDLIIIDRRKDKKNLARKKSSTDNFHTAINYNKDTLLELKKRNEDNEMAHFDPDTLCRSLRATKCNDSTIIMAIIRTNQEWVSETFLAQDLLKAGFNKYFVENTDVNACQNELMMIENESFLLRCKLNSTKSLFSALDHINDAIDICTMDKEIQYVNKAFEKMSEYSSDELVNCSTKIYLPPGKLDSVEMANKFLIKGKVWEGNSMIETKSGESVWHHCTSVPIMGNKGELVQIVNARTLLNEEGLRTHAISSPNIKNPEPINIRRPSLARIHSMTIEAPITRVINILTTAQQSSPLTVSQALDRVLDILHSSELYSLGREQLFSHHLSSNSNIQNSLLKTEQSLPDNGKNEKFARRDYNTSDVSREEDEKLAVDLVGNLAGINLEPRLSKTGMMRKYSAIPNNNYELREVHPWLEIPDDIQNLIMKDNLWDFPIFQLERLSHKKPLYYLAIRIFERFGLDSYLKCSNEVLHAWLQMIESYYKQSNSYHNSTHAADVLQGTAYFLQNPLIKEVLEEHEVMGALIAAVIHDLDHPGRNSAFLCNSHSELSILYNDMSVLESHHVALAFKLTLANDQCNIFKNLNNDEFKAIRTVIIDMVLATEMAKHFEILSKFLTFLDKCHCLTKLKKKENNHLSKKNLSFSQLSASETRRSSVDNNVDPATLLLQREGNIKAFNMDTADLSKSKQENLANDQNLKIFPSFLSSSSKANDDNHNTNYANQGMTINFSPQDDEYLNLPQPADRRSSLNTSNTKRNYWREVVIELLVGSDSDIDNDAKSLVVSPEDAQKNRRLILNMLIKCGDVSNPCRPLDICKEWSKRIAEEYFEQTDEEKRLNLPVVMPTFDRHTCNIPQSQISFNDYFVFGMYEAFDSFCSISELMENSKYNYRYWKLMADDIKQKRLSAAQVFSDISIPITTINNSK